MLQFVLMADPEFHVRPTRGVGRWIKDPYCGISHAAGAVAAFVALILVLISTTGGAFSYVGLSIYLLSAIALFTASALAHSLHASQRVADRLDRLDYACIFFLIAGSYTPLCLTVLRGSWGYTILSSEWMIAFIGASLVLFTRVPTKYISPLYVPMAWLVLVVGWPMFHALPVSASVWLLVGGIIYTLGAVVFLTHRPRLWPGRFGYHDLWHTMVLAAAACHFVAVTSVAL